jgi:hypothetical protein
MWDYTLAGIEELLNGYCSSYEIIAKDIHEGIDEGFSEGLRESMKLGFVEGIKECRNKGFDNIEVRDMEESLKNALETASDESSLSIVNRSVSNEYWAKISPFFKRKMEQACNKTVEEIKNAEFNVDGINDVYIQSCVNASDRKIAEYIDNVCAGIRKNLPGDVIFNIFFDCLQDEFNRDFGKNLKAFTERICKEIDNKANNKRSDHERH